MTSNDRHFVRLRIVCAESVCGERRCTHDVQGRDTEDFPRIEHAVLLEDLACDGQSAVHWVRDNADVCLGTEFGNALYEVANDVCIGLEEICD